MDDERIGKVFRVIEERRDAFIEELLDFLKIPSVSADSSYRIDVRRAAEWLVASLARLGMETKIFETGNHPIVFGELFTSFDRPTLLVYGHYDVQPPDPLDEWTNNPFDPSIRDGYVYARGASDDKGQLFAHMKALDAWRQCGFELPVNLKFVFEGEEEIGSPSLEAFLKNNEDLLKADAVVISDGHQFAKGIPAITYGLRGLAYFEVEVEGPKMDLHSGGFGGLVMNPIHALIFILSRLKDLKDRILIDNFYDDVIMPDEEEREMIRQLPFDEEALRKELGVQELFGEDGFLPLERKSFRPTLDINGIWGGYQKEGAKTIIPSRAGAKVSIRLVPNQRHDVVTRLFVEYLKKIAPPAVKVNVRVLAGADPVLVDRKLPEMKAAEHAIEIGFGKKPVFIREGGTIPVVNMFYEILGVRPLLMIGFGRPDDRIHGPDERFHLDDFLCGMKTAVALWIELAKLSFRSEGS